MAGSRAFAVALAGAWPAQAPGRPPGEAADAALDAAILRLDELCRMPAAIELEYRHDPSFLSALALFGNRHQLVWQPLAADPAPGPEAPPDPARRSPATANPTAQATPTAQPRSDHLTHTQVALGRPGIFGAGGSAERAISPPPPLAALGVRSLRQVWWRGEARDAAYIHHLRVHPAARGGTALARGWQAFRRASQAFPAAITLTSILDDNAPARALLENPLGRGALPRYLPLARFLTAFIPLPGPGSRWPWRGRPPALPAGWEVRFLTPADLPALAELESAVARTRDGQPVLARPATGAFATPGAFTATAATATATFAAASACAATGATAATSTTGSTCGAGPGQARPAFADLNTATSLLPGLPIGRCLGLFIAGDLRAMIGLWNQSHHRQVRLAAVHGAFRPVFGLWRLLAGGMGFAPPPVPGATIDHVLLDPWLVRPQEEARLLLALLPAALREARLAGARFAAFGLPRTAPAADVLARLRHLPYPSTIYQVAWEDDAVYSPGQGRSIGAALGQL